MNYTDALEYVRWGWVALVIPVYRWVDKKRKEYKSLYAKVESLEKEFALVNNKIDEDRELREEKVKEDRYYRKKNDEKLDDIHKILFELHASTKVNEALINKNNSHSKD